MSDVYMDKSNVFAIDPKQGRVDASRTRCATRSSPRSATAAARSSRSGSRCPPTGRESATDLPMRVAFPMLLVNTLDWFAGDQADLLTTYPTGQRERVPLDGVVGATEAEVTRPRRHDHAHAGDRRPRDVLRLAASATTTSPRRTPTASRCAQIELAANLVVADRVRHRAVDASSRSAARSSRRPRRSRSRTARSCGSTSSCSRWRLIVVEWVTYHRRITV